MTPDHAAARVTFATGMIAFAVLGLVYGDFAMTLQPFAPRTPLAYAAAVIMLAGGLGLLTRRTAPAASALVFGYLLLWTVLKIPALVTSPIMDGKWLGFGEIAMMLAGAWVLFARHTRAGDSSPLRLFVGASGMRAAQLLFGLAVLPVGASHFVYLSETIALVPPWLPLRRGWAYLTGAGQIAAGLGVLFSVLPRLAATAEAAMVTVFTLLVWVPPLLSHPGDRRALTVTVVSWAIAAGAWVVAGSFAPAEPAGRESSQYTPGTNRLVARQ